MSLFRKKDEHVGSGVDKPAPKGIVSKVVDKVKAAGQPAAPKGPAAP
jgi:hypothetical protein